MYISNHKALMGIEKTDYFMKIASMRDNQYKQLVKTVCSTYKKTKGLGTRR
jgi:hypothetical protein